MNNDDDDDDDDSFVVLVVDVDDNGTTVGGGGGIGGGCDGGMNIGNNGAVTFSLLSSCRIRSLTESAPFLLILSLLYIFYAFEN